MFRSKGKKRYVNEELPTIIVDFPSDEMIPFVDDTSLNGIIVRDDPSNVDDEDFPSDLPIVSSEKRSSLRRNSISLPNLDDLEVLKVQVEITQSDDRSNCSNSDLSDFEEIPRIIPLRNARRKSVIDPRMLKPPRDDESGTNSPANSVTSINSLASLLREKMQMLPTTFKKKKSPDYKIRIFVGFLFITIVVLISTAYVLYHQKVLQKAYFEKIKLNNAKRIMKIFNNDGMEIIHVNLGTTLNYDIVQSCLPINERDDGSICLEWMHRARFYLNSYEIGSEVKCYNLRWISLSEHIEPTDCFDLSPSNGHWYGGGQNAESAWPLEKGEHEFAPFITGRVEKHEWGNVLKRYFINSKGAAIIIDNLTPLYVSILGGNKKQLCFRAKYDQFAFVNHFTPTPELNYSICTAENMTILHSNLIENTLWDGLKTEDHAVMKTLLTEPLWEITASSKREFTEDVIKNYTEQVNQISGFLKLGHILMNEFWQKHVGDFTVDLDRIKTLEATIDVMHRRGFRVVLSIQPFISTESFNFAEAVKKRLLVSERFSDRRIPALTRYKSVQSAGILDVTNNKTIPWIVEKLKLLEAKYKFDAYYLDLGEAYNMPHYYQCETPLFNPDHYKTLLINNLQSSISLFGVNSAVVRPKTPTFVSLPPFESSWEGLRRVIPTILTYGILGYPFLIPGAVGGDFFAPDIDDNTNSTSELLPDEELYIRWLQLATFLPVMRFTHLPSSYGVHSTVLEMAKRFAPLRQGKVKMLLKKYSKIALDTGLPIIRPLWMLEPNDPSCHVVVDEFSIGDDLIIAPIMYPNARQREVYLPPGVWKDGIGGSLRRGSRWIHDYRVEEDQIAYFERKPDNTRLL